jgi:hypothetical protein
MNRKQRKAKAARASQHREQQAQQLEEALGSSTSMRLKGYEARGGRWRRRPKAAQIIISTSSPDGFLPPLIEEKMRSIR